MPRSFVLGESKKRRMGATHQTNHKRWVAPILRLLMQFSGSIDVSTSNTLTSLSCFLRQINKTRRPLAVATAVYMSLFVGHAHAELWPSDPFRFFSIDMHPVKVTLQSGPLGRRVDEQTFIVPRAWITIAEGYDPRHLNNLPDNIKTASLEIQITEPDGEPLSVVVDNYAAKNKIPVNYALAKLTSESAQIDILSISKPLTVNNDEILRRNRIGDQTLADSEEGLKKTAILNDYFGRSGVDSFVDATCDIDAARMKRVGLEPTCRYSVTPTESLMLYIRFPDFRFNGGVSYANSKVQSFVNIICLNLMLKCWKLDSH